jgi:hypothetical protein
MTTIVNTPASDTSGGSSSGALVALVLVLLLLALAYLFGRPLLRGFGTTNVNIPDRVGVDVNVNNPAQ